MLRRSWLPTFLALVVAGLMCSPAGAFGRGTSRMSRAQIASRAGKFCRTGHVRCAGEWRMVRGRRVFVLRARFVINRHGKLMAHAAAAKGIFQNLGTNTCWTSLGASTNGAPAELYGCNANAANQQWEVLFGYTGYGGSGAAALYNVGDGKCLNDKNGSSQNNNPQLMWDCYKSVNETYAPTKDISNPTYTVYTFPSQYGSSLSSLGNSKNNAPLVQYANDNSYNQDWYSTGLNP